jgi:phosphopantothenoylcysteine decarboxylase / phosphopantothenate---cysteine ligase
MLTGKKILLGVTGSIAAYKAALLTRLFVKAGAEVKVLMTRSAHEFITPLTLSTLSKNPVLTEFVKDQSGQWNNHVELGLWANVMIIAPASANTVAKMANGLCDNLLLATYLSCRSQVFLAPAMDLDMLQHPSTQGNLKKLQSFGNHIIDPGFGELASGLTGSGRMAEPEEIFHALDRFFSESDTLKGKKVLVTAGPTHEAIDPVRFIGNHSSGKMGFAIAEALASKGATVNLVTGPTQQRASHPGIAVKSVMSAEEMYNACAALFPTSDITVLSAAVADYKPAVKAEQKIKKKDEEMTIMLTKTHDIAASLGKMKHNGQIIVGFALETEQEQVNALKKLESKNFDLIVLNSLNDKGAGFGHDTNKITIIDRQQKAKTFELKSKKEVANDIVNAILEKFMRNVISIFFILISFSISGQELKCSVSVNASAIQTTDQGIFKDMKTAIEQFMNTRKWTNDSYKAHEKIACNFLITITRMPAIGSFAASVQVQSARPVYNSNYNSMVFNFADRDWEFEYIESLPLEYNDNTFTTNLTSMLAYYAYTIIGLDYDTFSELGGTPYFQRALNVVNNAQQTSAPGWQSLGSNRNRYWLTENLNNSQLVDLRKTLYSYHRLGLDTFDKDPDASRTVILKGLKDIKKVRDINPNAILVISFFDAKGKELSNIFSEGNIQVRREAYDIVTAIDPSNRTTYEKIIGN